MKYDSEMERVRSKARHDEAQAIYNAERKLNEHWQGVVAGIVAEKDAELAELAEQAAAQAELIMKLQAQLKN